MRHLSIALVVITAMILNLIADLNFAEDSDLVDKWAANCGPVIVVGTMLLVASIVVDILTDILKEDD